VKISEMHIARYLAAAVGIGVMMIAIAML